MFNGQFIVQNNCLLTTQKQRSINVRQIYCYRCDATTTTAKNVINGNTHGNCIARSQNLLRLCSTGTICNADLLHVIFLQWVFLSSAFFVFLFVCISLEVCQFFTNYSFALCNFIFHFVSHSVMLSARENKASTREIKCHLHTKGRIIMLPYRCDENKFAHNSVPVTVNDKCKYRLYQSICWISAHIFQRYSIATRKEKNNSQNNVELKQSIVVVVVVVLNSKTNLIKCIANKSFHRFVNNFIDSRREYVCIQRYDNFVCGRSKRY